MFHVSTTPKEKSHKKILPISPNRNPKSGLPHFSTDPLILPLHFFQAEEEEEEEETRKKTEEGDGQIKTTKGEREKEKHDKQTRENGLVESELGRRLASLY